MEVRVLRYFLAVAREQSISGAAKQLHVTQPTLSRQLQDLEHELGKQLLVRGSRRVTLTPEGMQLRRRAEEIVSLVDRTEAEVRSSDHDVTGTVLIGADENEGVTTLVRAAASLRRQHPGIGFSFVGGSESDTVERIDTGVVDFGILTTATDLSKLDSLRLPITQTWGVLTRGDSRLAKGEGVKADQLRKLPLVVSREGDPSSLLSSWFGTRSKGLSVVATYDLESNAEVMAQEGLGVVLTTDRHVGRDAEGGGLRFVPLEPELTTSVRFAWKKFHGFSRASQLFLEAVRREVARELAEAA